MNTWSHILAAFVLALTTGILHGIIRNDTNTRALDQARFYTMTRERGDVNAVKTLLESEQTWISSACRASQNSTNLQLACVLERRNLRDSILNNMKCFQYNSQVCTYLRNLTSGLIQNRTYGSTTYAVGRSLVGTVPNMGTLTYRQLLYGAVDNAPLLFHNSFRAAQADDFFVSRTMLYSLITLVIFANLIVHYLDEFDLKWSTRLIMRILVFLLATFLPPLLFLIGYWGSSTVFIYILLPSALILLYFEAFLDHTVTRPW
jgi:hypothetical protein